jgi:autotransporter-associated beta strand protein
MAKLATGTSTVNAANTYTGLTWVREGTLAVGVANPFAAASSLTVDSGATLDRAGFSQTVADAILNGTVANTGGGGLLTVTGTLSGSGVVAGPVAVSGVHAPGSLVDWSDTFWDVSRAWTVFDLASGVTTGFSNLSLGGSLLDSNGLTLDAGTRGSFSLVQSGQDVVLAFTAVPEPSTCAMALAGLACGGYLVFRRRKRA